MTVTPTSIDEALASLEREDPERLDRLVDVLVAVARGNLSMRLPVSERLDVWDAMGMAVNFALEELQERTNELEQRNEALLSAEAQARDQEAALRTIVDSVGDALIVYDHSGRIVEANRMATQALARGERELLEMRVSEIEVTPSPALAAEFRAGGPRIVATRLRRSDGSTYPAEVQVAPLPFHGRPHLLGVARDVSDRERAERLRHAVLDRTIVALEGERRRIAHELHDGPCQTLSSILMQMDVMGASITAPKLRERFCALREVLAGTVAEVRDLSHSLRPPVLDELGLVAALERTVSALATDDLHVEFAATGLSDDDRLPPAVATAAYRVLQEALHNAVRHAKATRLSVVCSRRGETLRLVVDDDGVGFDPEAVKDGAGLGLVGMKERARLAGGALGIETMVGYGTTLVLELPLDREGSE